MMQRRTPGYFVPPEEPVWERARRIRLLVTDVDGVLTDGTVYVGAQGEALKAFHIHDGKGLRMLLDSGIGVAWLTARQSPALERRAQELGVVDVFQGNRDKGAALAKLCGDKGLESEAIAFVGDDLVDLPALAGAGLAVAVADAHPAVKHRAHWITTRPGGRGAVREVCELILAGQGRLDRVIDTHEQ